MPEELESFPEKVKPEVKFASILDGRVWKINPAEYDYEVSEMKALTSAIKLAAKNQGGRHVRCFVTLDEHVIVQLRPADYKPRQGGKHKPKENV